MWRGCKSPAWLRPRSTGSSCNRTTRILSKRSQRLTPITLNCSAQTSYMAKAKARLSSCTDLQVQERRSQPVCTFCSIEAQSDLCAESVAEFTRRPLLNITAADLGHEPDALEKSLLQYFRRANDWDAIVLLDEADVYLEKRSTSDLKRNSIVSGQSVDQTCERSRVDT